MTFVLLAFATFLAWTTIASFLPFRVPGRLQPFVVLAIAYGLHFLPSLWLILVAATGGVALLISLVGDALDPWDWTRLKKLMPKDLTGRKARKPAPGVGARVPRL